MNIKDIIALRAGDYITHFDDEVHYILEANPDDEYYVTIKVKVLNASKDKYYIFMGKLAWEDASQEDYHALTMSREIDLEKEQDLALKVIRDTVKTYFKEKYHEENNPSPIYCTDHD